MVKVSVEVRSGSARFWVSVQAQSIRQVANIVARWYPNTDVTATVISVEPVSGNRSTRRILERTEHHNPAWVKVFDPRCRMRFPLDPEGLSVEDSVARMGR